MLHNICIYKDICIYIYSHVYPMGISWLLFSTFPSTQLFDNLRELAVSQGIIQPGGGGETTVSSDSKMQYFFLNRPVCRAAYATLMGVSWSPRLGNLLKAVLRHPWILATWKDLMRIPNLCTLKFGHTCNPFMTVSLKHCPWMKRAPRNPNLVMFGVKMKILIDVPHHNRQRSLGKR